MPHGICRWLSRLALLALGVTMSCSGQDLTDQFWPETNVFARLGKNTRLFALAAGTRTKESGYTDGQWGAHLDWFLPDFLFKARMERHPDIAKNRFLQLRIGYLYGRTPSDSTQPFVEHTPVAELTPRFFLPLKLLATDRNRVDFRIVNGAHQPRYRNRIKLERTFNLGKVSVTPYVHAEAFYDWRYHSFHRFRFAAGWEWELSKWIVVESYYLRQQDSKADPKGLDVAGLAVQFYLR